jgi:hypothetical protein
VTRLKQLDLGIDDIPYPVSDTSVTKILPSIRKYGQYHRPIAHPIFLWPNVPNTCETRMTKKTSFQTDIRPLFAECDIQSMSKAFNLGSYDDVKKHAAAIYDRIRGIGGAVMPPPTRHNPFVCSRPRCRLPTSHEAFAFGAG